MKSCLSIFLLILSFSVYGQEFSFQLIFTDAIGNIDTISLGYDLAATDSIDETFNEQNIISIPLDTSLDVRVTNEWYRRDFLSSEGTFHTKKQITNYNCTSLPFNLQTIDIHTKHWPVTVTWENSLFNDSCRNGSVLTSINPGGWWDTGSPSDLWRQILAIEDSITFTSNTDGGYNENYAYINGVGDTIPVFWQSFADSTLVYLSITKKELNEQSILVVPNPTSEVVSFIINESFGEIKIIEIYNSFGQIIMSTSEVQNVDVAKLMRGLYFVKLTYSDGVMVMTKFEKL